MTSDAIFPKKSSTETPPEKSVILTISPFPSFLYTSAILLNDGFGYEPITMPCKKIPFFAHCEMRGKSNGP